MSDYGKVNATIQVSRDDVLVHPENFDMDQVIEIVSDCGEIEDFSGDWVTINMTDRISWGESSAAKELQDVVNYLEYLGYDVEIVATRFIEAGGINYDSKDSYYDSVYSFLE